MLVYADTSALVKLILPEVESEALADWRKTMEVRIVTSELTRAELMRAVRRIAPQASPSVTELFETIAFISLDYSVYDEAAVIPPLELRSLDAIHLTAARLVGSQLDGMLTYDARLAEAAQAIGLRAFSPP